MGATALAAAAVAVTVSLAPIAPSSLSIGDDAVVSGAGAAIVEQESLDGANTTPTATGGAGPAYEPDVALVQMADGIGATELSTALAGLDFVADPAVSEEDAHSGLVSVKLAEGVDQQSALDALSALPEISFSQPNYYYYLVDDGLSTAVPDGSAAIAMGSANLLSTPSTNDPFLGAQWGLKSVKAYDAWNRIDELDVDDYAVSVAVLDTGCRTDHEDLKDAVVATYDASKMFAEGSFGDIHYHGTHVCGIIADTANNELGVAGIGYNKVGVVPIEVFQVVDFFGNIGASTETLVDAYNWITENADRYNIRAANMSLGREAGGEINDVDWALLEATEEARAEGVLSLAAAGNDNSTAINMPADSLTNGISIIALESTGNDGVQRAEYSNFNAPGSSAKQLSVPGSDILAAYACSTNQYVYLSGTSMATPMAAGAAALISAANPDLTPLQVKKVMLSTAKDIYANGFDEESGYGELDLSAALDLALDGGLSAPEQEADNSLAAAEVDEIEVEQYNEQAHTPKPVVHMGDIELMEGVDYTLSYKNNVAAGFATVVIEGIGDYTGSTEATFFIEPKKIWDAEVTGITSKPYDPTPVAQNLKVVLEGKLLVPGIDYVLEYRDANRIGQATVIVWGSGNYDGGIMDTYMITPADIAGADIVEIDEQEYSGWVVKPEIIALYHGKLIEENIDYTTTFKNNIEPGTATVVMAGKGSFVGKKAATFRIVGNLENATISGLATKTYTGNELTPAPVVKLGTKTLKKGRDYTVEYDSNVNAGQAGVYIEGIGDYVGDAYEEFTIAPASIAKAKVSGVKKMAYTGYEIEQDSFKVMLGGKELAEEDYSVTYYGNVNPGTATMVIEGEGNYKGTITKTFTITRTKEAEKTKGNLSNATVTRIKNVTYDGEAWDQEPLVKIGKKKLVEGDDYSITYFNNVNAGTARVVITGEGDYTGSIAKTFKISPINLSKVDLEVDDVDYEGGPTLSDVFGTSVAGDLVEGVDFVTAYKNTAKPGKASVTVTGKGNYTGSVTKSYLITADLSAESPEGAPLLELVGFEKYADCRVGVWVDDNSDYEETLPLCGGYYDGAKKTPVTGVKYNGIALTKGTDYVLHYENNVEVGVAIVTVEGKGVYEGSEVDTEFEILAAPISSATISGITDRTFNMEEFVQPLVLKRGDKKLVEDEDYTVTYEDNYNAGKAKIIIEGIGNYSGKAYRSFKIAPRSINKAKVESIPVQAYTGRAVTVNPEISVGDCYLDARYDLEVTYVNNTKPGTATVTFKGIGDYTGSVTKTFKISADLSVAASLTGLSSYTYSGSACKPTPTVWFAGSTLTKGTDYTLSYSNNVNAGTATVYVTGKGKYSGTARATFQINPRHISSANISALAEKVYNGSEQKQNPTLTMDKTKLVENKDYTLSYKDAVHAGIATMTVEGKGNYTGTVDRSFRIGQLAITNDMVQNIGDQAYAGTASAPEPVVRVNGQTLVAGTDYTTWYTNNTRPGVAGVTVYGRGDYAGAVTKNYNIKADLGAYADVAGLASWTYTGKALKQVPTVRVAGKTLTKGTDYTLSYRNNVNVGTATVVITGKGIYTGVKEVPFGIVQAANPMKVTTTSKTVTLAKVKKNAQTLTGAVKASGSPYSVSFAKVSGDPQLSVNSSNGAVTVAKGTPKGTYTASVQVTSNGNGNYQNATKTVTVKVVVKK